MIVFSSVSKSFAGNNTAIDNFSLEIKEGDLLVITGPSGAGKTTLMKLMIKEYEPNEGEISFNGQKISELQDSEIPLLRRKIAVVFQDYKLISDMNVWENIALPMEIAGKKDEEIEARVTDLLNLVELTDKALHFPRQLSGGEAQRISIARALATNPKLIFADEPTGNLDSKTALRITRLLKKINELGTTLVFATHDDLVLKELAKEKIIKLIKKEKKSSDNSLETDSDNKIQDNKSKKKEKIEEKKEEKDQKKETINNESEKAEEKIKKAEEIAFESRKKRKKKKEKEENNEVGEDLIEKTKEDLNKKKKKKFPKIKIKLDKIKLSKKKQ